MPIFRRQPDRRERLVEAAHFVHETESNWMVLYEGEADADDGSRTAVRQESRR
jgi:hypothetical protein